MNSIQIETWALKIMEQVENRKPDEDTRVELKSTWPDPIKAARQLAAHANSIHGEPILWLIGVDQKSNTVVGAERMELSTWYQKVIAEFDEIAPSMKDINVNYKDKTVVALFFETERFPFVIKTKDGWLEVPWREGTSTRSAKRSELLKILSPLQYLPNFEFLSGEAMVIQSNDGEKFWSVHTQMYLEPFINTQVVIPFHRCSASIETKESPMVIDLQEIRFYAPGFFDKIYSKTMESTPDELLAYGPGRINFSASTSVSNLSDEVFKQDIQINIHIRPVGTDYPSFVNVKLVKTEDFDKRECRYKWIYIN